MPYSEQDDIAWEFQKPVPGECGCANCRSGGEFEYCHGYIPSDCLFK